MYCFIFCVLICHNILWQLPRFRGKVQRTVSIRGSNLASIFKEGFESEKNKTILFKIHFPEFKYLNFKKRGKKTPNDTT